MATPPRLMACKEPDMTDKEAFDMAAAEQRKIAAFLDKPRCISCMYWTAGNCEKYGPVPESHWYAINTCKDWDNCPF